MMESLITAYVILLGSVVIGGIVAYYYILENAKQFLESPRGGENEKQINSPKESAERLQAFKKGVSSKSIHVQKDQDTIY